MGARDARYEGHGRGGVDRPPGTVASALGSEAEAAVAGILANPSWEAIEALLNAPERNPLYSTLVHGHDERIAVEDLAFGTRFLHEVVVRFCSR